MRFSVQFVATVWDATHEIRWLWVVVSISSRRTAFVYEVVVTDVLHWQTALKSLWNRSWFQLQRDRNCIELRDKNRLCKRALTDVNVVQQCTSTVLIVTSHRIFCALILFLLLSRRCIWLPGRTNIPSNWSRHPNAVCSTVRNKYHSSGSKRRPYCEEIAQSSLTIHRLSTTESYYLEFLKS